MDCQICMEPFAQDNLYKVCCSSQVDHLICFGCEDKWRSKMPVRDGTRVMTCPTCRQPESVRTYESMQRELAVYYAAPSVSQTQIVDIVQDLFSQLSTVDRAQVTQITRAAYIVRARTPVQIRQVQFHQATQAERDAARAERDAAFAELLPLRSRRVAHQNAIAARAARATQAAVAQEAPAVDPGPNMVNLVQEIPVRPVRFNCSSGRDCNTRSQRHTRTKTHLKCRTCHVVPCCMNCKNCTNCVPV